MDSFLSQNKKPTTNNSNTHQHKTSTSDLFSSAKVLADAAKGSSNSQNDKLDKAKVADAAGDLLCAASQYGKLDETSSMGKYVNKAEEYLHNYNSSSTNSSTTTNTTTTTNTNTTTPSNPDSDGGNAQSGYGDYLKMAGGLFKN